MKYTEVTELRLAVQRARYADDVRKAVEAEGWTAEALRERDGDYTLIFSGPELAVMLHVMRPRRRGMSDVPLLHWHAAKRDLKGAPGAWNALDVNPFHHRKATSFPTSLNDAIERLVVGIRATKDGTAFQAEA